MPRPPLVSFEWLSGSVAVMQQWVGGRPDGPSMVETWNGAELGAWQVWAMPAGPARVIDPNNVRPPYRIITGTGTVKESRTQAATL